MHLKRILPHVALLAILGVMLFPLLYMIGVSVAPAGATSIGSVFGGGWHFTNYTDILSGGTFPRYIANSFFVASIVAAANALFCTMAAFAFSRKEFRGKGLLFGTVLSVMIMPAQVVMIPLYRMMTAFGWINTYWALIVPWVITPFGIFMMRQYIAHIPRELEDAARIDGAGEWRILLTVVMPLAKPMLVLLVVCECLSSWTSFRFPFLFTNDEAMRTLPVGLAFYLGKQSIDWGHLMAGATISALPVIVLFLIFQRRIVSGLMAGALKG